MNHLKDVFAPPLYNAFYVDIAAEVVVGGNVRVAHFYLARIIETYEVDHDIGKVRPLLELPLQLELRILVNLLVDCLNRSVKHFEPATNLEL